MPSSDFNRAWRLSFWSKYESTIMSGSSVVGGPVDNQVAPILCAAQDLYKVACRLQEAGLDDADLNAAIAKARGPLPPGSAVYGAACN